MTFNKVIIAGNLADDVDLRQTNSGKSVANMVVAVNDYYSDKVNYITVKAWNKIADNCEKYLSKGSGVLVEGKLQKRSYEKDGEKRYITEVVARNIQFLTNNSEKSNYKKGNNPKKKQQEPNQQEIYEEDDDIPF